MYLSPSYIASSPVVFLRLCSDINNYYEYRVQIQPGWAPYNNSIEINLPEITAFKNEIQTLIAESVRVNPDTILKPAGRGFYRVKGNPSLTNITRWEVGIYNPDRLFPISGEVWIDELRLSNVRRNPGNAQRADLNLTLADFSALSGSFERRNWDFHDLITSKGSGVTTTSGTGRATFQLGKFFPTHWNLSMPLAYSYTKGVSLPRLKVGSDIVLPDTLRDENKSVNVNKAFNINLAMKMAPAPLWVAWTLNRMQHSYSLSQATATSPTVPSSKTRNETIYSTYDLSPGVEYLLAPLGFVGISSLSLTILPSRLFFTNTITTSNSQTLNQYGNKSETKRKDLNQKIESQLRPWKPLSISNTFEWRRDIRRGENITLTLTKLRLGLPVEKRVTTQIDWSPTFFSWFLTQRYAYNSSYMDNSDPERNIGYFGSSTRIQRFTANTTLNLKGLFGSSLRGGKGSKFGNTILNSILPITSTYIHERQQQLTGLKKRPIAWYQLGFTNKIGAETMPVRTVGTSTSGKRILDDLNAQTGAKLPFKTDLNLSLQARREHNISSSEFLKNTLVFPNMTVKWGFISDIRFIKKYTSSISLSSSYSKRRETEYQQKIKTKFYTENGFNPLFDLSIGWRFGLRTQVTYRLSSSRTENMQAASYTGIADIRQNDLSIDNSYSFRAPHGLKIPLLGTLKIENNLNLGCQISRNEQKRLEYPKGGEPVPIQHLIKFALTPRGSYDFSTNLRSGLSGEFSDTRDVMQKRTTKVRALTIWFELRF